MARISEMGRLGLVLLFCTFFCLDFLRLFVRFGFAVFLLYEPSF